MALQLVQKFLSFGVSIEERDELTTLDLDSNDTLYAVLLFLDHSKDLMDLIGSNHVHAQ